MVHTSVSMYHCRKYIHNTVQLWGELSIANAWEHWDPLGYKNASLSWCLFSPEVFYHHRGSVWGVRIQDDFLLTGSMDGTISVIHIPTLTLKKHFLAHEDEWGGECSISCPFFRIGTSRVMTNAGKQSGCCSFGWNSLFVNTVIGGRKSGCLFSRFIETKKSSVWTFSKTD